MPNPWCLWTAGLGGTSTSGKKEIKQVYKIRRQGTQQSVRFVPVHFLHILSHIELCLSPVLTRDVDEATGCCAPANEIVQCQVNQGRKKEGCCFPIARQPRHVEDICFCSNDSLKAKLSLQCLDAETVWYNWHKRTTYISSQPAYWSKTFCSQQGQNIILWNVFGWLPKFLIQDIRR